MPGGQGDHIVPAHKLRDELRARRVEHVAGGACLFNHRVVHDDNVVRQGQRFVLAMCDVNEADPQLLLQLAQLCPHPHTQERIKRRQRLIQQQNLRSGDQCTRKRDPLLLSARQLVGQAIRKASSAK